MVWTLWCTKRPLVGAPCSNDKNLYQTKAKRSIKTIVFTRRYLMLEKINHFTETRKWTNRLSSRFFWKSSWHLSSCISYTLTIILSSQLVFACSQIFGRFFFSIAHIRFIKILTWLRSFREKIANFSPLDCLAIPRRDLSTKKTKQNKKMTRKPRSHAKISVYRTWAILYSQKGRGPLSLHVVSRPITFSLFYDRLQSYNLMIENYTNSSKFGQHSCLWITSR